jgi:hypothetical protein
MIQEFTGTNIQICQMPVVSTLVLGQQFFIINSSTGRVTINSSGGNTILVLLAGQTCVMTCLLITGTGVASWSYATFNIQEINGGVWTPTLYNTTNVAASSVLQDFDYVRVGSKLVCGGSLSVDPTATGATQVDFTIPFASALVTSYDISGTGACGTTGDAGVVLADATNDRASYYFIASSAANANHRVIFVLTIK